MTDAQTGITMGSLLTALVVGVCLNLSACIPQPEPGLPLCRPLPKWSAAEQDALAAELDHQDGPLTHRAVHEFEQLRASSRTCLEGSP